MAAPLAALRLRSNPGYELVPWNRLGAPPEPAQGLPDYGLLRPRPGLDLPARAVCRETALLVLTQREAGPPPCYLLREPGAAAAVAALVLDGVLEVETPSGFATGAAALATLGLDAPEAAGLDAPVAAGLDAPVAAGLHAPVAAGLDAPVAAGLHAPVAASRTAALSHAAVALAARLGTRDPVRLAAALYGYNRLPAAAEWRRRLPDTAALRRFLGLDAAPAWMAPWREMADGSWLHFRPHGGAAGRATCKLYLSPLPQDLPRALPAAMPLLGDALQWKIGADAWGLLRPDKWVAYFADLAALQSAASRLAEALRGIPPQGVPFTAEAGGQGLLSWGADPAMPGESWRGWVARHLADGLAAGDARTAVARLALTGIDTVRFAPRPDWQGFGR